jgi:AcrR family transcriptional regulator
MSSRPPNASRAPKLAAAKLSRAARTRERILEASHNLFNTFGEPHVNTGHIADELNISPGNLYYHFRNKGEIIRHLFAAFEERIDVAPRIPNESAVDPASIIEDLWLYLHFMFESIWDYRFLYRNLDDLLSRDPRVKSHFNRIIEHKRSAVCSLFEALVRGKAMQASDDEISMLGENVLIVATYWLNFQHISTRQNFHADLVEQEDLSRGVYQVMALVAPYLRGRARDHLDHISRIYVK